MGEHSRNRSAGTGAGGGGGGGGNGGPLAWFRLRSQGLWLRQWLQNEALSLTRGSATRQLWFLGELLNCPLLWFLYLQSGANSNFFMVFCELRPQEAIGDAPPVTGWCLRES